MKALSLLQPWASLAVLGLKTLETRNWTTAYRGPLVIHAGKGRSGRDFAALPAIRQHLPPFDALPFGALLGTVQLVDVLRLDPATLHAPDFQARAFENGAFGSDVPGRWAFVFETAEAFETPEPYAGRLGLFDLY